MAVTRKRQQSSDPTLIDAAKEEVGLSEIHDLDGRRGEFFYLGMLVS